MRLLGLPWVLPSKASHKFFKLDDLGSDWRSKLWDPN
jgi:hypothetical protein